MEVAGCSVRRDRRIVANLETLLVLRAVGMGQVGIRLGWGEGEAGSPGQNPVCLEIL